METIPLIRQYRDGDRLHVQAQQIWIILCAFVSGPSRMPGRGKTITYGEVAEAMGYGDKRVGHLLSRQLSIIGTYCRMNRLPKLNAIVVAQSTGAPGAELILAKGKTVRQEQKEVFQTNWMHFGVPTTGTLRKVWASMPS